MQIKNAEYKTSVASLSDTFATEAPEIAIAGRSNVGKSSFINMLTGQRKLARASSEPGRTRMINYFSINGGEFFLVDLPGYGYAKVSDSEKEKWGNIIDNYLKNSINLKNVFLVLDIRHAPSALDKQLAYYLSYNNIATTIVATKTDKLSKSAIANQKTVIAKELSVNREDILAVSALDSQGKDSVLERIDIILK